MSGMTVKVSCRPASSRNMAQSGPLRSPGAADASRALDARRGLGPGGSAKCTDRCRPRGDRGDRGEAVWAEVSHRPDSLRIGGTREWGADMESPDAFSSDVKRGSPVEIRGSSASPPSVNPLRRRSVAMLRRRSVAMLRRRSASEYPSTAHRETAVTAEALRSRLVMCLQRLGTTLASILAQRLVAFLMTWWIPTPKPMRK